MAPELEHGDYVVIAVIDSGSGMPPEVLERAFEPFFTTKEVGKGSGLGLAQVFGLARQFGGAARLQSAPGRGHHGGDLPAARPQDRDGRMRVTKPTRRQCAAAAWCWWWMTNLTCAPSRPAS